MNTAEGHPGQQREGRAWLQRLCCRMQSPAHSPSWRWGHPRTRGAWLNQAHCCWRRRAQIPSLTLSWEGGKGLEQDHQGCDGPWDKMGPGPAEVPPANGGWGRGAPTPCSAVRSHRASAHPQRCSWVGRGLVPAVPLAPCFCVPLRPGAGPAAKRGHLEKMTVNALPLQRPATLCASSI